MKKRILALICAATMVVGAGISASAAESPTASEIVGGAESPTASEIASAAVASVKVDGATVKVEGTEVRIETAEGADVAIDLAPEALSAAASSVAAALDTAPANAVISAAKVDSAAVAAIATKVAEAARFVEKAEVKLVDIKADAAGTFTLNLGIAAGQKVKVFHYEQTGAAVEVACTVADGKVSFNLQTYSPVAIVVTTGEVAEDEDEEEEDTDVTESALPTTSPKTADAFAAVALLAVVSGGASAVLGRRSKKNE